MPRFANNRIRQVLTMKSFLFTLISLFLFIIRVQAQGSLIITGSVTDKQTTQSLPYCSVALFKSQDSTLVGGVLTNENGRSKFENIPFGRYYIQAQYIGYVKSVFNFPDLTVGQTQLNLPTIAMDADPRTLREVKVSG